MSIDLGHERLISTFRVFNPIIILEGIDASGKSSLSGLIRNATGAFSIHPSNLDGPVDIIEEYLRLWNHAISGNRGVIFDRFLGSEFAYSWYESSEVTDTESKMFYDDKEKKDVEKIKFLMQTIGRYPYVFLFTLKCSYEEYLRRMEAEEFVLSEEQFNIRSRKFIEFTKYFTTYTTHFSHLSKNTFVIDTSEMDKRTLLTLVLDFIYKAITDV